LIKLNLLRIKSYTNFFLKFIKFKFYEVGYDENYYKNEQIKFCEKLNINFINGKNIVDEYNTNFPNVRKGNSLHWEIFAGIKEKKKILSILEIGTDRGEFTHFLNYLFPHAKITTIDLPKYDEDFINSYNRKNKLDKYLDNRDNLIKLPNVTFKELNSLQLTLDNQKYDLIWVDGAHGYPVISIDIANSIRLANKNALIFIDDVYKDLINKEDPMRRSMGSYQTLEAFKKAKVIDYSLLHKRTKKPFAHKKLRKFIGVIIKK